MGWTNFIKAVGKGTVRLTEGTGRSVGAVAKGVGEGMGATAKGLGGWKSHGILPRTPPTAIYEASLSNSVRINHIAR